MVGVTGNPGQANYAASKAGLIGMTKALAAEVASRDVTVNCVAPGFIKSPMTDALNDKQKEAVMSAIPSGRWGEGADVAAAVVYLASREAAYVTGQDVACEWRDGNDLNRRRRLFRIEGEALVSNEDEALDLSRRRKPWGWLGGVGRFASPVQSRCGSKPAAAIFGAWPPLADSPARRRREPGFPLGSYRPSFPTYGGRDGLGRNCERGR